MTTFRPTTRRWRTVAGLAAVLLVVLLPDGGQSSPAVVAAPQEQGQGLWLVATDGGVFGHGNAGFLGSTGDIRLNRPIVGMAATPTGAGYWLVASDGGIFSFGDARFLGSTGDIALNRPVVGMAPTPTGAGYWLVASDGGIFSFGDAAFLGSAPGGGERQVVGLLPTPTGRGYWEATTAGEVLAFGDATLRSDPRPLNQRVVGLAGRAFLTTTPATPGDASTNDTVPPPASPAEKGRPNVLVVVMDDMREDGVMNDPAVLPMTKRWLAEGGTTFAEAYATTPLCCPERATIWSGRLAHNHGVIDNYHGDTLDRNQIIPRFLKDAGYRTALVGKFLDDWKDEPPYFDDYAVFQDGYVNASFRVRDPGVTKAQGELASYSTDFIADKAVQYIHTYEGDDDRPWYLHVTPHAPQGEEVPPADECNLYAKYHWPARHDRVTIPSWRPTPAASYESSEYGKADKVPYLRPKTQSSTCSYVDHNGHMKTLLAADEMMDRIMSELEAKGELDNTLVIFTTDNGYSWGERGVTSKGLPYGEHVSTPFLVRWPGVFPAGAVDPRPVGGEDLLPTLLEAAGFTPAELGYPLDGVSFLPGNPGRELKFLEFGPPAGSAPSDYQGHRGIPTWASFRTSTWQYIEYYGLDNTTVEFREYYDLTLDPWALDNLLADTNPANDPDVAALSAALDRARYCTGREGPSRCP